MGRPASALRYVSPVVLERVEAQLEGTRRRTGASALLLVEHSGLVLSCVGEPALHPDQMGPVAAGVLSAMQVLLKVTRAQQFVVCLPHNTTRLYFQQVEPRLFLCAFYAEAHDEEMVLQDLMDAAHESRSALQDEPTEEKNVGSVQFIEDKLNEIFGG